MFVVREENKEVYITMWLWSNDRNGQNSIKKKTVKKISIKKKESLASKIIKIQHSLKPEFNFKIDFSLEKYIKGFFDKIAETILNNKTLKAEDNRKINLSFQK